MIIVRPGEIPEEGLRLKGETTTDIFAFEETETEVRPAGPVDYDLLLLANVGPDLILAQGTLVGRFHLRCVVCLEEFPFTLRLDSYAADFDIPPEGDLDLTERLREDLLLELPSYPHCDRDGDDPDRVCPCAERVAEGEADPSAGESRGSGAWDALDELSDSES